MREYEGENQHNYENRELPPFDSRRANIGMDASEEDSSCSIDIIENYDKEQMEVAKHDLNKIFSKINKSLQDLGDLDDNGAKSGDRTERTEVSFQINMTNPPASDYDFTPDKR